jgi:hypothetical protein
MNDFKNLGLAWFSTVSTVFTAVETRDILAIISAVVLPVVFFTVGKAIDVMVQIRMKRWDGSDGPRTLLSARVGRRKERHPAKPQRGKGTKNGTPAPWHQVHVPQRRRGAEKGF